jgi:hypothetical protein
MCVFYKQYASIHQAMKMHTKKENAQITYENPAHLVWLSMTD